MCIRDSAGKAVLRFHDVFDLHTVAEVPHHLVVGILNFLDVYKRQAVTNERELLAPNARDDSIPRICWGKYILENDRVYLGISVEVNHRPVSYTHLDVYKRQPTRPV